MRRLAVVLCCVLGTTVLMLEGGAASARSRIKKHEAIRELLVLTGAANLGMQMMDQMLEPMKQMMPEVPESFWQDFMAEVDPDEMNDLIVPIYAKHFTLEEIESLIAFNKTPLGQKLIKKMPLIMQESMTAGQVWGQSLAERALEKYRQGAAD